MTDPTPTPPRVEDALAGLTTVREKWRAAGLAVAEAMKATRGLYTTAIAIAGATLGAAALEWQAVADAVLRIFGMGGE